MAIENINILVDGAITFSFTEKEFIQPEILGRLASVQPYF